MLGALASKAERRSFAFCHRTLDEDMAIVEGKAAEDDPILRMVKGEIGRYLLDEALREKKEREGRFS